MLVFVQFLGHDRYFHEHLKGPKNINNNNINNILTNGNVFSVQDTRISGYGYGYAYAGFETPANMYPGPRVSGHLIDATLKKNMDDTMLLHR
jgi:hypothetical protein